MLTFALTVETEGRETYLSPFFAKANLIVIAEGGRAAILERIPNKGWTGAWVCEEILHRRPDVVIAGFVGPEEAHVLTGAAIDVRLGPCSVPIGQLIQRFRDLPRACASAAATTTLYRKPAGAT